MDVQFDELMNKMLNSHVKTVRALWRDPESVELKHRVKAGERAIYQAARAFDVPEEEITQELRFINYPA